MGKDMRQSFLKTIAMVFITLAIGCKERREEERQNLVDTAGWLNDFQSSNLEVPKAFRASSDYALMKKMCALLRKGGASDIGACDSLPARPAGGIDSEWIDAVNRWTTGHSRHITERCAENTVCLRWFSNNGLANPRTLPF
jgi:hypothetical protein